MTWVKVCGLTGADQVAAAQAAGADAVGFVLVEASPRFISMAAAGRLIAQTTAMPVILTLDVPPRGLVELAEQLGAQGVQPYGSHATEAAAAASAAGLLVLRPVAAGELSSLDGIPETEMPLIDQRSGGRLGGTGESFDWGSLASVDRPFVLAGGLHPDNVGRAISSVRPWGVDASSGLESSPGVKDVHLIEAFVKEAKQA